MWEFNVRVTEAVWQLLGTPSLLLRPEVSLNSTRWPTCRVPPRGRGRWQLVFRHQQCVCNLRVRCAPTSQWLPLIGLMRVQCTLWLWVQGMAQDQEPSVNSVSSLREFQNSEWEEWKLIVETHVLFKSYVAVCCNGKWRKDLSWQYFLFSFQGFNHTWNLLVLPKDYQSLHAWNVGVLLTTILIQD